MKRLLRLYPARWRREYGDELNQVLDDLGPLSLRRRISVMVDLPRDAADAQLWRRPSVDQLSEPYCGGQSSSRRSSGLR